MDARWSTALLLSFVSVVAFATPAAAAGLGARTQNFIIQADSPQLAQQVGQEAERYRSELAQKWLGRDLPPWPAPCTLKVVAGNIPAQGVTTYNRYPGHVGDFQMEVMGTPERIMDSVLPHEVTHAVLATHFGRPLPRWADEGVSTTVEHPSERSKHDAKLREFLSTRRGLPMNRMFLLKDYPSDMLPLYAQGYSVCRFLIEQNGHRDFITFIEDYMEQGSWTAVVQQHYGYETLAELQENWLNWVADGSGPVARYTKQATEDAAAIRLAAASQSAPQSAAPPMPANMNAAGNAGPASTPPSIAGTGIQGPTASEIPARPATYPAAASGPAASVASLSGQAGEGGWYLRRRREVQAGGSPSTSESPAVATATAPTTTAPSVTAPSASTPSPYSVSQPQPEQGGTYSAPAGPAAHWSPSQDTRWR